MRLLALASLVIVIVLVVLVSSPEDSTQSILKSSVTVMTLSETSGGSGTIMKSTISQSLILTNAHVCRAISAGGVVKTSEGATYFISSTISSAIHDLCLVTVMSNLGVNTRIATSLPLKHSKAYIVGHPHLYPTVLSTGYFSGKMIIQISDIDPTCPIPFLCAPKLITREVELVSALIQPGSSGSGIFNERGELSAVVFAGSGDLGYALSVPLEYVYEFLFTELKGLVSL